MTNLFESKFLLMHKSLYKNGHGIDPGKSEAEWNHMLN